MAMKTEEFSTMANDSTGTRRDANESSAGAHDRVNNNQSPSPFKDAASDTTEEDNQENRARYNLWLRDREAARTRQGQTANQANPAQNEQQPVIASVGINDNANQQPAGPRRAGGAANMSLQAYLLRQQLLAGIRPENMISLTGRRAGEPPMRNQNARNRPCAPALVRITGDGVVVPEIPPAQFNGVIHRLPNAAINHARAPLNMERHAPAKDDVDVEIAEAATCPNGGGETRQRGSEEDRSQASPQPEEYREIRDDNNAVAVDANAAYGAADYVVNCGPFNLIRAITGNGHVATMLILQMNVQDIIKLYSTSRDFHDFMNAHMLLIPRLARRDNPLAAHLFPWNCYPKECIKEPVHGRQEHATPEDVRHLRAAPSFRWFQMLSWRMRVIRDLVIFVYGTAAPFQHNYEAVVGKVWFLMDIPDNIRRSWTIRNMKLWRDEDLFFAAHFLVFYGAHLTVHRDGRDGEAMRRLLLAQPSLSYLWTHTTGRGLQSDLEVLRLFIRWKQQLPRGHGDSAVFGISTGEVGMLQYEAYGQTHSRALILTPDALVFGEIERRQLDMQRLYADIHLYPDRTRGAVYQQQLHTGWVEEIQRASRNTGMDWREVVLLETHF